MVIQFIQSTSGPRTEDRILEFINTNPQGIAAKKIAQNIGRPISMVQICLKYLLASGKIYQKIDRESGQRIYFLKSL